MRLRRREGRRQVSDRREQVAEDRGVATSKRNNARRANSFNEVEEVVVRCVEGVRNDLRAETRGQKRET
jgi:hypothetical protein